MIYIKNGTVIDPGTRTIKAADILIQDGIIRNIIAKEHADRAETVLKEAGFQPGKDQVIDAEHCYIGPGLVDVHVHFRDPGFTYKEDIMTGAKAAAKGGFTTVVLMANTKPTVDSAETLSYVLKKGEETGIRVESCCAITKGLKGEEMTDMSLLMEKGAAGFTDDGIPILKEELVTKAMEQATALSKTLNRPIPLSFHEEDPAYIQNNGVNHGRASEYFEIGGSDRQAEISLVKRDLSLALQTGACFNVQHISTKEAVELVRQAKQQKNADGTKNNIHAEATPHHIMLTEEATISCGTLAKMNPPLRTEEDRQAIIAGIADGTIDLIATDHAPHAAEEKAKPITEAPSGIIGLETAFGCAVTELVKKDHINLIELFDRMSYGPAKMYGFDRGYLAEGGVADLILFDPDKSQCFDRFVSKSSNSPFLGQTLYGMIKTTICKGNIVYQNS